MAKPTTLRVIPRSEFAEHHFPQAACQGPIKVTEAGVVYPHPCRYLNTCAGMLGQPKPGTFWLVRDGGICARNFFAAEPPDVRSLRRREVAALADLLDEIP